MKDIKQLLVTAGYTEEMAGELAEIMTTLDELERTEATDEERAEIRNLAAESMTLKLQIAGILPLLDESAHVLVTQLIAHVLEEAFNERK